MIYENIIIGSGPTAVTIANEILKLSKKVTIIDIGKTIEKKNLEIKREYLKTENKKKIFFNSIKKNKIINKYKNPHLKFPFGSEFVFQKKINMKILLLLTILTTFFLMHMVDYQIFGGQWYLLFFVKILKIGI